MLHPLCTVGLSVTYAVIGCEPPAASSLEPDQLQAHDTIVSSAGYHMLIPCPSAYHWSVNGVLDAPDYSIAFVSPIQDPPQALFVIGATLFSGLDRQSPELLDSFDAGTRVKWEHDCSTQNLKEGQVGRKTWALCEDGSEGGLFLHLAERTESYYFELTYSMSRMSFEKIGGMPEIERIVNTAQVW
jgi:hypothetical protein